MRGREMRLIFLGPPGVGKGTQAKMLSERRRLPHVATGDILRAAVKNGTAIGLKAKEYIDRGDLVPDEIVIAIVEERLKEADCAMGFILDGFPRTVGQAEALERVMTRQGVAIDSVVCFTTPREVVIERLSGRRMCEKCGANFHVSNRPPRRENICDACGGALVQRKDDNERTISDRLDVYERETKPLVTFYRRKNILNELPAIHSPEKIFEKLEESLWRRS